MSAPVACPNCGAPLVPAFSGPAMVVCSYCASCVAIASGVLTVLGASAKLVKTPSRFALGAEVRIDGAPWRCAGRTQYAYEEGLWDEWLLVSADGDGGATARLSDDEGDLILYERLRDAPPAALDGASPGASFSALGLSVVVAELGEARVAAAAGSLDRAARPGETFAYVDGHADGGFVSLRAWRDRALVLSGRPLDAAAVVVTKG